MRLGNSFPVRVTSLIFFVLKSDLLHPWSNGHCIPRPETLHGVLYERLEKQKSVESRWCEPSAWIDNSPTFDFHTKSSFRYIWGLPLLVATCPEKLLEQGPRKKYVDIVTDTLHASSSDLITWNTLATKKLKWKELIPELWLLHWLEITAASLDAWDRDQQSPFPTRIGEGTQGSPQLGYQAMVRILQHNTQAMWGRIGRLELSNQCVWIKPTRDVESPCEEQCLCVH